MHELDAERLAVGAAQDREDLAQRREFEARAPCRGRSAVEVGFGEAVGARIELLLALVAARARADRDWHGSGRACGRRGSASARGSNRASPAARRRPRSRRPWPAPCALILSPTAFSTSPQSPSSAATSSPSAQRPVAAAATTGRRRSRTTSRAVVLQALEEGPPLGVDRGRIGLVAGMEVFDIGGVAAVEERGAGERRVRVLARHR